MKTITSLLSLILLTALLCGTGCTSTRLIESTRVPEVVVDAAGGITFNNKRVEPGRLAKAVKAAGITREQEVNILVPFNFDPLLRKRIYAEMLRGGYTRTIFVTDRKASSFVTGSPPIP